VNELQIDLAIGETVQIGPYHITLVDIEGGETHLKIDSDWGDVEDAVRLGEEIRARNNR
jgi:hypothetical protein